MKIFLSYAKENKDVAEKIAIELRNQGNDVFLDVDDLPAAGGYDKQIRDAILKSDLMIFLISPWSVAIGRYTLTELDVAQHKWKSPKGKVLPVMVSDTPFSDIDPYLKAVTILQPIGDFVQDVCHAIFLLHTSWAKKRLVLFGLSIILLLALIAVIVGFVANQRETIKVTLPDHVFNEAQFKLLDSNYIPLRWGGQIKQELNNLNIEDFQDYKCLIEYKEFKNIEYVEYDDKCQNITIKMVNKPFVDKNGTLIKTSYEKLPISVSISGELIWSQYITLYLSNGVYDTDIKLEGLELIETERSIKIPRLIWGKTTKSRLVFNKEIEGDFTCDIPVFIYFEKESYAYMPGVSIDQNSCNLNFKPYGEIDMDMHKNSTSPPNVSNFSLIITHNQSGYYWSQKFPVFISKE